MKHNKWHNTSKKGLMVASWGGGQHTTEVLDKKWSKLLKVMKWLAILTILKLFFDYAYVSPETFFAPPPPPPPPNPVDNIFGENLYDLVKILGNVGQNMTTQNVDCFTTSLLRPLEY
jgi:hypothetical protein